MPRLISRERRAALVAGLLRTLARLPLPLVHALGAGIGSLLAVLPNATRRIAARNLEACFPALDARARRRLLAATLRETAKGMLELGALWLWPGARIMELVREVRGEEAFAAARAGGRGALVFAPHLGAWEVAGLYMSAHYPITSLYRPTRLGIDALVRSGRERMGATLVPTDQGGVRAQLAALKRGEVVGILPDQDPGAGNGEFAPFFGISACTMTLASRLAMKSGAQACVLVAERLPRGQGYRLTFTPLAPAFNGDDLGASLAALNAGVEAAVRACPAQYLWAYKRFKTRPAGEPPFYRD